MTRRAWSLARRLTTLYMASVLLLVAVTTAIGYYLVRSSLDRELSALTHEELQEFIANTKSEPWKRGVIDDLVDDFQKHHRGVRLAWRVWKRGDSAPPTDFGDQELLTRFPPSDVESSGLMTLDGGVRWRTEKLDASRTAAVVIDARTRLDALDHFKVLALASLSASAGFALLLGWFVQRRVSRILERVAEDIRSESNTGQVTLDARGAPREIQALTDALRERLERLRRESEKAKLFTASLAHELRSPIQNLVGETEVVLRHPRDAERYRKVLESNLHELRELGDAVDNLLTMCSPRNQNDSKVYAEEFDLGEEVELRLARERSRARQNSVELVIARRGDMRIVGDREALLRALRNLAANAIEWSPLGARVEVALEGDGERVVVVVDDQGPGVAPEIRSRIFEPFFTGPAKNGHRVGYGLGLAIAHDAVDHHGGSIAVANSPAGGARFRVELPRRSRLASLLGNPLGDGRSDESSSTD